MSWTISGEVVYVLVIDDLYTIDMNLLSDRDKAIAEARRIAGERFQAFDEVVRSGRVYTAREASGEEVYVAMRAVDVWTEMR